MTEPVTEPINKLTTYWHDNVGIVVPTLKQYQHNDKYRDKTYAQNKSYSEMKTKMLQVGGQTRDRLRKKLDAKHDKQNS